MVARSWWHVLVYQTLRTTTFGACIFYIILLIRNLGEEMLIFVQSKILGTRSLEHVRILSFT